MATTRNRLRAVLASRPSWSHRAPASWRALATGLLLVAALAGCLPPQASFDLGLGTSRIKGVLLLARPEPPLGGPLIVVYKYHHQFVNRPDGSPVLAPTAHVLAPDADGRFSFSMPSDVVRVVVWFVAPGHLTDVFRFQRQLGVGEITYRAELPAIADWRDHYFIFLSPQLQELVVDPRYKLAPAEQQRLARWLEAQNERLASPARGS